jgi:hypothetical protein
MLPVDGDRLANDVVTREEAPRHGARDHDRIRRAQCGCGVAGDGRESEHVKELRVRPVERHHDFDVAGADT